MIESQYLDARYPAPIIASEIGFHADARLARCRSASIPDEHDEYGWFTFAEAYERIRWTDDREALELERS